MGEDLRLEMILVTKEEYEKLLLDSEKLLALEVCGVDRWPGYPVAMGYIEYKNNEAKKEGK